MLLGRRWNLYRWDNIPKHCFKGLPEKPGKHSQLNPPGVLVQTAFIPHFPDGPLILSHSSISKQKQMHHSFTARSFQITNIQTSVSRLTHATGGYIIGVKRPTLFANAVCLVTVRLTKCVKSTSDSFARLWKGKSIFSIRDFLFMPACGTYLCTAFGAGPRYIRFRIRNGNYPEN